MSVKKTHLIGSPIEGLMNPSPTRTSVYIDWVDKNAAMQSL